MVNKQIKNNIQLSNKKINKKWIFNINLIFRIKIINDKNVYLIIINNKNYI